MENGKLKKVRLADVPFGERKKAAWVACTRAKDNGERLLILYYLVHPGETVVTVKA